MKINHQELDFQADISQITAEKSDACFYSLQNLCVHEIFQLQVERSPESTAVIFENRQLTYKQLNQRANQLAQHLRRLGVKPEIKVGIYLERSLEMVIGLLGILKAGGSYVPLDPAYPTERTTFILGDTQTPIILTQEKFIANLIGNLPQHQPQIISLDSDWEEIAKNSPKNLLGGATLDNLIYTIYTSGSTGRPKGVMVPHRGISNQIFWRQTTFGLTPTDKVLQNISFSFDPSVWQIFWPLCYGAQLVLASPSGHKDISYLVQLIAAAQITVIAVVPSILRPLLEEPGIENCQCLKHVTCGGEALPVELIERFHSRLNLDNVLYNCYGPTETSIDATFWPSTGQTATQIPTVTAPIGLPITNMEIYILDENLQPVPIGETGELHIGGVGLARGYLNLPELTAEKFIPHPFKQVTGERLYKTGDLGRYLPDGNIEFLGRIDSQVKIRGFRIELAEIETILSQYSGVNQALVVVREDIPGDQRLVAYVVPDPEYPEYNLYSHELREFLADKLPEYMVPYAFVLLESLPLNPNGKIDYQALPIPDQSANFVRETSFIPPRNPTEEILAAIWSQVLGVEQVGVQDNFFALGGHSLLATKVIARCRQTFSQPISLKLLFENPTIAQFADSITQDQSLGNHQLQEIIPRISDRQSAPLSFAQQRVWFWEQLEPNSSAYNISQAFRLVGNLRVDLFQQALDAIATNHESLRTNFISGPDGTPLQVINSPRSVELKVIDFTQEQIQEQLKQEIQRPFCLASDLMLRATLFQIAEDENILLLVLHHIAADGWSIGILWQQLSSIYAALLNSKPLPLVQLPIQYADFAIWQRQWLSGEVLDRLMNYWKTQLAEATTVLELPTDRPRPPIQTYRGASQSLILNQSLSKSLREMSLLEGVTLFMVLLTAFSTILHRYTEQEDILIGCPIAGRNRSETEGLIGFFINTVVLRTNFAHSPSFRSLLRQVRQMALDAYTHQDMPFEKLVEELQPDRDLSRNPLFQVWFNMLNLGDIPLELSDLIVQPFALEETTAKFDLSLYVIEESFGIQLELVYNADLFNADTIQNLLEHYQTLLVNVVSHPEDSISSFPILTNEQYQRATNSGNRIFPTNHFIEFSRQDIEQSIPARFAQVLQKYPHNLAIHTKNYQWTYRELNYQSNCITQEVLRNSQFDSQFDGERVALLFEHDAPMIAAILGVLQAGKTYIPLDPNYPIDRIIYILENSLAHLLITNNQNLLRAKELSQGKINIINIDDIDDIDDINQSDRSNHTVTTPKVISPDTIAYILYTSGSTGNPKGVVQNHRNVLHFIRNYTNNLHINQQDRLTLLSSYSFDAAIMDIFGAILNGATLYPIDIKEEGLNYLSQWLINQKITIYHSTPTLYRYFISTLNKEQQLSHIRLVVLGGEEVVRRDVELYREHFADDCLFVNGLGPTESTVTLQYFLNKQTEISRNTIPVGYPVEETEILLLNEAGEKTNFSGEIAIRSHHIALGYWQDPTLSQTVFLPDPEGGSKRIYRTGDMGHLRPNGSIEFLGRRDFQVKIRGFRIELGEVESVLKQHHIISETVVIVREDIPGEKQLTAYFVPHDSALIDSELIEPIIDELRCFLKRKLPAYMIPVNFIALENLPLTPSGKVNRRGLSALNPAPNNRQQKLQTPFLAPRNTVEHQLTEIWQQVLGIKSISIKDNFFDLGGHSLLAIKLFWYIEQKFGQKLPLSILFQSGTIETIVEIISPSPKLEIKDTSSSSLGSSLVKIQPQGSRPPFFCIHGLGGEVLCFRNLAVHLGLDQPFYGIQPVGLEGKTSPYTRVEDMANHYIREMRTVQSQGPYFLGGYSFGGIVAFEAAKQLLQQGEEIGKLIVFDTCLPGYEWRSPFWKRIFLHLENILSQGPAYLGKKIIGWSQQGKYQIQNKYKHYLKEVSGFSVTDKHLEIIGINDQAARAYTLTNYPGRITLIRTEDRHRDSSIGQEYIAHFGWGDLAQAGVDIHYVPGSHISLFDEPQVQVMAEKLKECLWEELPRVKAKICK